MITRCHHFGAAVHTNTTTTTIVKEWDFASISKDQQPCSAPRYPSSSSLIDHHFYFTIDGLLSPTSLIVSTRQLYYYSTTRRFSVAFCSDRIASHNNIDS